jgi:hypothetical protein
MHDNTILPSTSPIAGDDWIVDCWVYGDMNPEGDITMRVFRADGERDYCFKVDRKQARALATSLLNLAADIKKTTELH